MNFAHGELYMLGAYAGIAVIGVTQSFWVALVVAPLLVGVVGAVTEVATLRPLYRREPLYGLILTFGLALVFRVDVRRVFTLTFAGSAALAALAGLLLAPVFTVYPQMGVEMILLAFIVVILGGMGSLGGSVVAAFVIAIFGIMIVVLIVRPRGFFGREGVLE